MLNTLKLYVFYIIMAILYIASIFGLICLFPTYEKMIIIIVTVIYFLIACFAYQKNENKSLNLSFTNDKAEWQIDNVTDEYCAVYQKDTTDLTAKDEEKISMYAAIHIAYFITWIIRHDFISEEHLEEDLDLINKIKNGETNGLAFLENVTDYTICRDDFSEDILPFLDSYYNASYYYDFFLLFGESYLIDFTEEKYQALDKIITKKYQEFNNKKN